MRLCSDCGFYDYCRLLFYVLLTSLFFFAAEAAAATAVAVAGTLLFAPCRTHVHIIRISYVLRTQFEALIDTPRKKLAQQ